MNAELAALDNKQTWSVVNRPTGVQVVPLKWVYSYKFDDNGYIGKFKARICVRSDLQRRVVDLVNNRALTLAARTFRFMMALACAFDLEMSQMDMSNAFLNAEIPENEMIFTECAPGCGIPGHVYRLHRALYGMIDSPVRWLRYLDQTLIDLGFRRIQSEPCLYTNSRIMVMFYVDDIAIFSRKEDSEEKEKVKKQLAERMEIKDCGDLEWFLRIRVTRDRDNRRLWLSHDANIDRIVNRFGLQNRPLVSVPLTSVPGPDTGVPATRKQSHEYLERIGSSIHPAYMTRPDIASAVSTLASYSANPSPEHMAHAERCIVYMRDHKFLSIGFDGRIRLPADFDIFF